MSNTFRCGTAKADITPDPSNLDGLFGLMSVPYAGIIDPLHLRVLAFSDGVQKALIISFDLDKAPNPVTWLPMVSERTGVPIENITYLGTHTHSAPITTHRPREVPRKPHTEQMKAAMANYEAMVKEKLLGCVDHALANMCPAKLGYGTGKSYINVNRNAEFTYEASDGTLHHFVAQGPNNTAPVDRTVFVFKVEDENGKPMAFFVNYPVHCCTMFLNRYDDKGSMGISSDLAGTVSRYIEAKFPGSVAVWSSGAAGDVNPIIGNEVFYADPVDGRRKDYVITDYRIINELMISLAARHYADVLEVIRGIDNCSDNVEIGGALEWSETPALDVYSPERGVFEIRGDREAPYRIRMHLLRLGDVALCGIGGELYNSFGRMLKEKSPFANTVIINHEASLIDDAGYILDDETLARCRRKSPVPAPMPGSGSASKPGFVGPSLLKHLNSMCSKVVGNENR